MKFPQLDERTTFILREWAREQRNKEHSQYSHFLEMDHQLANQQYFLGRFHILVNIISELNNQPKRTNDNELQDNNN
jgi:hypothetical protein